MAKFVVLCFLMVLGFAFTSSVFSTVYMVGDNSGWDISTNIDTWTQGKRFVVGDALLFQYSSSHGVDEVTKDDYDNCNTGNALKTHTNGNTTVPLTQPGTRYFACSNLLHCYAGMKLQVNVQTNQTISPAGAPQPGSALQQPSSKSDNNNDVPVDSGGFVHGSSWSLVLGFVAALLVFVQI